MDNSMVSVIIPFLNGGAWLAEAIESVLNQSYTNWEVILIDDGSTEEHTRIALDYASRYSEKIQYTEHAGHINRGVTVSRNLGISLASGNYLAFLDADDCWLPQKLQNQLNLFALNPQAAVICEASLFWYSWNSITLKDLPVNIGAAPDKLYAPPELLSILYPLGKGAPPCPTGIIMKKEVYHRSGGFEESFTGTYQLYEDQAFLCKVYLREKVYISGEVNNKYRKRSGSLTEAANDEKHYYHVRLFFLNWFEQYLSAQKVSNSAISALVNKAKAEIKIC